jgi:hypothetical protein
LENAHLPISELGSLPHQTVPEGQYLIIFSFLFFYHHHHQRNYFFLNKIKSPPNSIVIFITFRYKEIKREFIYFLFSFFLVFHALNRPLSLSLFGGFYSPTRCQIYLKNTPKYTPTTLYLPPITFCSFRYFNRNLFVGKFSNFVPGGVSRREIYYPSFQRIVRLALSTISCAEQQKKTHQNRSVGVKTKTKYIRSFQIL